MSRSYTASGVLCNNLQNVGATTYKTILQRSTFLFCTSLQIGLVKNNLWSGSKACSVIVNGGEHCRHIPLGRAGGFAVNDKKRFPVIRTGGSQFSGKAASPHRNIHRCHTMERWYPKHEILTVFLFVWQWAPHFHNICNTFLTVQSTIIQVPATHRARRPLSTHPWTLGEQNAALQDISSQKYLFAITLNRNVQKYHLKISYVFHT